MSTAIKSAEDSHMKLVCRAHSNRGLGDSEDRCSLSFVARALKEFTHCYPSSIMDPSELRMAIERFRILIIGRANAGKTTILQRVCKTRENPEIYNSAGKKVQFMIPVVTRMMMVNRCTLHWKSDRSRCVDGIQRGKACS